MNKQSISSKLFSFITSFLLIFNTFTPLAYAQVATPPPAGGPSPTPAVEQTAEPTVSPSPTPTVVPTATVTPTASPEVSPAPAATPEVSPSPSPTPQVSPNPPPAGGELTAVVLPDTSATSVASLDLDPVDVTTSASLITDKADYAPTDTAVISGTGLKANTTYTLVISSTDAPAVNFQTNVTTDEKGGFVYAYQLDGNYRPSYKVELKDGAGNIVATTTFTDSYTGGGNVDLYSQCSNDDGDGYATGDIGCRWTNGNLNASNSTYHEDDATVQRLGIDDLTNGDHTVIIKYSTTKGGKHTYDFMADDDFSELAPNPLTNADLCDPAITNLDDCATLTPVLSGLIPTDSNAAGHDVARPDRHFKIRNGTWANTPNGAGSGILSGPTLIEGTYAGDSETIITLKFNVNTYTCANKYTKQGTDVCEVLITWGAHVSSQADWGTGNSAVNVSGSPYHVQIADVDGTATQGGGRDNQMAASAIIQTGHLIVQKTTNPAADPTVFTINTTSSTGGTITGGGSGTVTDAADKDYEVTAGTYSVAETVPSGWDKTGDTCQNVIVAAGETKTCQITNTKRSHIIVAKDAVTNDAQDFTFSNNFGNGNPGSFILDDDSGAPGGNSTYSNSRDSEVLPGSGFSVSEAVPAGWKQFSATCTGEGNTPSNITVTPGGTVTCTFVNHKLATIIVVKNTSGGDGTFGYTTTGGSNFFSSFDVSTTTGTGSQTFNDIDPDLTYSVAETSLPSEWDAGGVSCINENLVVLNPASFSPNNGGTVTCTFTNTKRGHIIIDKVTYPSGDSQSFEFDPSWSTNNFNLTDTATPNNSGALAPGTYSISEGAISGWTKVSATCSDGSPVTAIDLSAGETITCTFTNVKNPKISISPTQTNKVDDEHIFTVTLGQQGSGGFVPVADGTVVTVNITPSGFTLVSDTCASPGTVNGECTVTINSTAAQIYTAHASASVTIGGHLFNLSTDRTGENSQDAVKTYVDVKITLNPLTAENNVNAPHTVTVTVTKDPGTGPIAAAGEHVDFTLTPSGATPVVNTSASTCDDIGPNTDASGQCIIVFTSATPGSVAIHATVTLNVGGVSLTRATDGTHGSSGDATKTYVAGKIIIEKQTLPDGSSQTFEFNPSWSTSNFNLTDGQQNDSGYLALGTYNVSEGTVAGWDSDGGVCNGEGNTPASITLHNGDVVTCTFTNTQKGHIVVDKVTDPSGDTKLFNFNTVGVGYSAFSLRDTDTPNDQELVHGSYSVSEVVPTGWDLTNATCDDDDSTNPASLTLDPGETIHCAFTNTKQGTITIVKDATPNDLKDFEFNRNFGSNFFLDDDAGVAGIGEGGDIDRPQSQTFNNLAANNDYTVQEILPAFWQFQGVSCVNADQTPYTNIAVNGTGVEITLNPGAAVTCTFSNFKPGPTRTQGFWQTHTAFTSTIFGGSMGIGTSAPHRGIITNIQLPGKSELFGAYYSSIAMKSGGKGKLTQRSPVDQARMVLLQQLVTAKLNCPAFGCSSTILSNITAADLAYFLGDIAGMQIYNGILGAYNNSGDTIIISPPLPAPGKATPKTSQSFANIVFWDSP